MGFLLLAVEYGALDTDYGRFIFAGLIACAMGDVLLLSRETPSLFKTGIVAFALGHVFYILGANHISRNDIPLMFWVSSFLIGIAFAWAMFRYFKPYLSKDMMWPVGIYTFIISLMCIYAVQTNLLGAHMLIIPAAFAFAMSDIFVGRDRFIKPDPKNFVIITPLYFGAQAMFAVSVAT